MGEKTNIAWCDHSLNPWLGCQKVSPGCNSCYAETLVVNRMGKKVWGPASTTERHITGPATWRAPFKWNRAAEAAGKRARVFCASLADVFEAHPQLVEPRARLWELIHDTPWLDWQLLTKRPENIPGMLPPDWGVGYRNVWLGFSAEDQRRWDERMAVVRDLDMAPPAVWFCSFEPLLEAIIPHDATRLLDWAIIGGESGPKRRPVGAGVLAGLAARLGARAVPVFFKQVSALQPGQPALGVADWLNDLKEFPVGQLSGRVVN